MHFAKCASRSSREEREGQLKQCENVRVELLKSCKEVKSCLYNSAIWVAQRLILYSGKLTFYFSFYSKKLEKCVYFKATMYPAKIVKFVLTPKAATGEEKMPFFLTYFSSQPWYWSSPSPHHPGSTYFLSLLFFFTVWMTGNLKWPMTKRAMDSFRNGCKGIGRCWNFYKACNYNNNWSKEAAQMLYKEYNFCSYHFGFNNMIIKPWKLIISSNRSNCDVIQAVKLQCMSPLLESYSHIRRSIFSCTKIWKCQRELQADS